MLTFAILIFFVVFFSEVGGSTLDSHHGFVVEYGTNRDVELGRFFKLLSWLSDLLLVGTCIKIDYHETFQSFLIRC